MHLFMLHFYTRYTNNKLSLNFCATVLQIQVIVQDMIPGFN